MAVLVKITNASVDMAKYDAISSRLIPALKQQPGFHAHFAYGQDGNLVVQEIWDSRDQHTAWFEGSVRPNMPPEATPKIEVIELHNVATKG